MIRNGTSERLQQPVHVYEERLRACISELRFVLARQIGKLKVSVVCCKVKTVARVLAPATAHWVAMFSVIVTEVSVFGPMLCDATRPSHNLRPVSVQFRFVLNVSNQEGFVTPRPLSPRKYRNAQSSVSRGLLLLADAVGWGGCRTRIGAVFFGMRAKAWHGTTQVGWGGATHIGA